jgi:hypothetical protein
VESEVHQPLGDVHGRHARFFDVAIADDDLVHAGLVVRNVPGFAETRAQVVRVEHGKLCGAL